MNIKEIEDMAKEAGLLRFGDGWTEPHRWGMSELERFAELVATHEREKVSQLIMAQGYATGHGDTIEEMLKELDWQVRERVGKQFATYAVEIAMRAVEAEREACAKVADEWVQAYEHPSKVIAETIRQRKQA